PAGGPQGLARALPSSGDMRPMSDGAVAAFARTRENSRHSRVLANAATPRSINRLEIEGHAHRRSHWHRDPVALAPDPYRSALDHRRAPEPQGFAGGAGSGR